MAPGEPGPSRGTCLAGDGLRLAWGCGPSTLLMVSFEYAVVQALVPFIGASLELHQELVEEAKAKADADGRRVLRKQPTRLKRSLTPTSRRFASASKALVTTVRGFRSPAHSSGSRYATATVIDADGHQRGSADGGV